ncbi:alpha/beta fold hydrolase [Agromyces aurantiacus]|uniref:Alpha/beta fold hydrolase n=1 Tax=Agromyces aurantiacus TaxID=165814 RepID=A0ABV9R219_9MICO|nr:alpha/beta hydrolase [Agromyces aurantiacus]MBM7505950.1 pimeloyl-ACP methyl ester carboxylesterase [Agromyces aurantiacus]
MRYVRAVGRVALVVLVVVLLSAAQEAVLLGLIALGAAPGATVWISFAVVALLCLALAAVRGAVRARRAARAGGPHPSRGFGGLSTTDQPASSPVPTRVPASASRRRKVLPVAGGLWVAASLLSLVTFLRLDLAPMGSAGPGAAAAPRVDVRTTGDAASSAPPLIVVHGGPGVPLSDIEESAVEELGRDRAVVVYDQAGTGRSDPLADPLEHTLAHAVDELARVVDATGAERVDLLGYSWGASVATVFAVEHPERVERMALISPGAIPWRGVPAEPVGPQDRLDAADQAGTYLRALSPRNLFVYALTAVDPRATRWFASDAELDERFLGLYESTAAGLHCDASQIRPPPEHLGYFASQVPQLHADLSGVTEAEASSVDLPMLVVRGACDYIPARFAEEYVDVFDAELVPIDGAGHALLEDRRDAVLAELARFLG